MALDKAGLVTALKSIFEDLSGSKSAEDKATEIADAIDAYVKTATVNVTTDIGQAIGSNASGAIIWAPTVQPLSGSGGLS